MPRVAKKTPKNKAAEGEVSAAAVEMSAPSDLSPVPEPVVAGAETDADPELTPPPKTARVEKPAPRPPITDVEDEEPAPRPHKEPPVSARRDATAPTINIAQLQAMNMPQLTTMAKEMVIENFGTMKKQELIFQILQKNSEASGILFAEGVLEVMAEGYGFLRSQSFSYMPCPEDVYVSPSQ
ncbi:MAG: Rho termination factor N-terminal domain-containing protein, partial [Verrucomicrobia bacterium]|nr:Rho termination factor N-terminal domain-containing protein [Verrucomicrobiota bacterium]